MPHRFAVAICTALVLLARPTPADAWWEFLEALSGPGPFRGPDIQFRLRCWVRQPPAGNRGRIQSPDPDTGEFTFGRAEPRANFIPGAILNFCRLNKGEVRVAAFDVGGSFLWTSHDTRFANGDRIFMTTIEPSMSYNLFNRYPNADYLDVAVGGGVYWFNSKDFEAFMGGFLEPVRIEFHPTTNFKQTVKWAKWIPVVRAAYVFFPGGFDTTKFNATTPSEIGPDFSLRLSVFFDLQWPFKSVP
jgi:hypothetical protein